MTIDTEQNIGDMVYIVNRGEIKTMTIRRITVEVTEQGTSIKVSEPNTQYPAFYPYQVGKTVEELLEKLKKNYNGSPNHC